MRTLLVSSLSIAVLLGGLSACGSKTRRNPQTDTPDDVAFCNDYCARLAECGIGDADECAEDCASKVSGLGAVNIPRARECLDGACSSVVPCVSDALGSGGSGSGGSSGSAGSSAAGGKSPGCPGAPVKCLDEKSAEFCNEADQLESVVCADAMAEQGIVSNGCESNAQGDGCTIDAFLDPECESGTPAFAICTGLTAEHLVNTYTTCFDGANGASTVIPCYAEHVNQADLTVDCAAAQLACPE